MNQLLTLSALLACVLCVVSPAAAQEPTETPGGDGQRVGLADFGQTTVLDSLFNPAISFVGDFVASWSEKDGRQAGADGLMLRGAELGIFGAVDDVVEYHGVLFFDEEEIELEEAYVVARDWLPDRFSLKAGRYNIDFGKQSAIHDHDLPTLDKPSTLQEYIGGTVRGSGAEVHWWTPFGDVSLFRASLGVLQSADSDAHVVLGPGAGHGHGDEDEDEEGPIRDIEDFAVNARVATLVDVSEDTTLQVGASYLHAPTRVFGVDETDERDVDQGVFGVDVTLTSQDEETGAGYTLQGEYLMNDRDFGELDDGGTPGVPGDDTFTVMNEDASGFYFLAEKRFNDRWAVGASVNVYEHAENSSEDSTDVGLFITHWVNEFNRLRFEVRSFEDLAFEDDGVEEELDFVAFSIQWTVILGSHGHGLEW
ncbi:MAG: hypothetical protein AAF581_21230 [Planctomycetota bacterium]